MQVLKLIILNQNNLFVRKLIFFILSFTLFVSAYAQPIVSKNKFVKTWKISERFAIVDSIQVDTMHVNYQDANLIDRFSIANSYNGNLGSPIQSKLYFDRPENTDFIFSNAYFPYLMNIGSTTFYTTKTPFSNLNYVTGGTNFREEDHVKFLFTANANKKLNIGTKLDYIYAGGEYGNQAVQRFAGSLFGTYNGNHYTATGLMATNNLSNFENGGIENSTYILNPIGIKTKDIPTNLEGFSNYKQNQFYFNHQYSIGFERPIRFSEDSVRMEYVPVTRFAHTLKIDDVRKRYYELNPDTAFYDTTKHLTQTNDTASLQTFTNNFSISMAEEFNKWMKFGLTAFVENEIQRYSFLEDTLLNSTYQSTTKIGGILSKQRGQKFRYNVLGELNLLGYKAGDFLLDGSMGGFFKLWNDSISLVANGFVRTDKPSYFLQNYQSNHFAWNNSFENIYRTRASGTFSIPTRSFSLNVSVENLTNYIYFNDMALPTQFSGNIQVFAANFKQDFRLGAFTLENNIVYQISSQPALMPLPDLTLFHNLYVTTKWFNVLSIQLGANVRYHSVYYAPTYMPAIGQFYTQSSTEIGNYPLVNAYLNFHLKRTRFFVQYYHVNNFVMNGAYFSMPNYPINPAILKMGLSWNFYD